MEEKIAEKLENFVALSKQWEEVLKKHSSCCKKHLMEGYLLACKANRVIDNLHVEFICTQDLPSFDKKLDELTEMMKEDMKARQEDMNPKVEVTFMTLPMKVGEA